MLIKPNGHIEGEGAPLGGKRLYIFGLSEIPLRRSTAFKVDPFAYASGAIASWGGDVPACFNLSWSLTAGFDHVALKDREALLGQIKLAHAFGASAGVGPLDKLKGPPKVRLVIPGHINCTGVIRDISTSEKGPWDTKSSQLPTRCDFTIEFVPFKSYDPDSIVTAGTETWLAEDISGRFYQGG